MLLECDGISKRFGGVHAVADVQLLVAPGQVFGLIGPNGAGKTTLVNLVSGHLRVDSGATRFDGADVTRLPPHALTARGIARTFQGVRLFKGLTVLENVLVGRHARMRSDVLRRLWPRGAADRPDREKAARLLERLGLSRPAALAGGLAYGDQRRLEIARAMCTQPALLCLDEPAAGLNARESASLSELLLSIRADQGTSILLIEHDMSVVMEISDHVVVLDHGVKIADAGPREIRDDPKVIAAYLGVADEADAVAVVEGRA